MEPVPYEIQEDDVNEVLSAYESVGGHEWTEERREAAQRHVMQHVLDLNETVRSAPEDDGGSAEAREMGTGQPAGASQARRDAALAAIEDLLIRDGFIDVTGDEDRVF